MGRDLLLWGVGSAAEGKCGACSPRIPAWRVNVRRVVGLFSAEACAGEELASASS